MAYCDYQHCAICDTKAFYDANIDWEYQRAAKVLTLCLECSQKWNIQLHSKEGTEIRLDAEWTNEKPYRDLIMTKTEGESRE